MAHLRLSLLGSFRLSLDDRPVTGIKSNKARALLAYLAVEGVSPHSRQSLAGLLWPDWPDRAAVSNLRYTLSNLRSSLRESQAGSPFLLISRDYLQFNASSDQWIDVTAFSKLAGVDRADPSATQRLEEAVALYQGRFLEGFSVADSASFEDWVVLTRERLGRELSSALEFLASTYEQRGDYERAQVHARRQLELEPWDETTHRQMMRLLALSGERSAALAQYQVCRRVLARELNVEPSQETTRLFEQIRDGALKPPGPTADSASAAPAQLPAFLREEPPKIELPVFVARQREMQRLDGFLARATIGQAQVAFVTGEAGSGKTAMLQEFGRHAEDVHADLVAVSGKCSAYTGIGDPYLPFREILELLTGDIEARATVGTISRETARRLWQMLPATVQILVENGPALIDTFLSRGALVARARAYGAGRADWLKSLEDLLERKPPSSSVYTGLQQSDLFEQYTRVLQALAQERALILLLDDLQWADPGSISLLFHLGRNLAGSRILIVGAYRPEQVSLEKDGERHPLEPLVNEFGRDFGDITVNADLAEGKQFIDAYLASEPSRLGQSFRQMLWRQTRGQPLFTIELLRGLQERGDLVKDEQGFWIEGPSLDWETLPARVEAAIRERISRMPEALRRVLAVASVEGEEFTAEVVAAVRNTSDEAVLEQLSTELDRKHRLVRADSIQRVHGRALSRFRFRHILFQKYLYGGLDEVERVHLHEQVGTALEGLYATPEGAGSTALELARHFQEAGVVEKAIHYLHRAGDAAVRLCAYSEGSAHLHRALALLRSQPESPERARLELALQLSLGRAGRADILGPDWQGAVTRARELCAQTGQVSELSLVLGEQATLHYVRGEYQEARELGEEVLSLAEESGDPLLVALGHWRLGFVRFGLGQFAASRVELGHVLTFYRPQIHHQAFVLLHGVDAGLSAMTYDACCLWCLGYPEQALRLSQEALVLAHQFGHAFSLADVLSYGGAVLDKMRRDARSMREHAEELVRVSEGMGGATFVVSGACHLGDALAQLGQVQEGIAQLEEGLAQRQSRGSYCTISGMVGSLAEAHALAGHPEQGMLTLDEAFAFVEKSGERHWEAELHRLRAELLLAQGQEAEAETSLHKAIDVARRQQAKSWELRATVVLSRLWQRQGKRAQAQELLEEIYNWFTEGFETADLIEARTLLERLS